MASLGNATDTVLVPTSVPGQSVGFVGGGGPSSLGAAISPTLDVGSGTGGPTPPPYGQLWPRGNW